MSIYQRMLRVGGYLNFAIALAHIVMLVVILFAMKQLDKMVGTPIWMGKMLAEGWVGWMRLSLMIAGVAAFVGLLGLYGFSGAGRIRRLPLLRTGLICTSVIFIFNGAPGIPVIIANVGALMAGRGMSLQRALGIFIPSWILTVGLLYLAGTAGLWKTLHPARRINV